MDDQGENGCTLKNRSILLGITGSIAAFKVAGWASTMVQEGGNVSVMMTESSTRFVSSLTFAALTSNQVVTDMFGEGEDEAMAHITLSRSVDAVLIAPATAQTIARLAHGMADDLISTAVLASEAPVVVCPAMNSRMLAHPATQRNINILKELGYFIVKPDSGMLACGEEGSGRLPEWDRVREELLGLFVEKDFLGRKVLITAGPTREPIDPARYLSNRSSGKMGYALARVARRRGGRVTLVSGPVNLAPPPDVECVNVLTAAEMHKAVMERAADSSIIIKAAAVADFKPQESSPRKIKKSGADLTLELTANPDILAGLGKARTDHQLLVGFAAESDNHEDEGQRKLYDKNVDLMVVNDILGEKTGFDVDTNQVTLVTRKSVQPLPLLSKEETAGRILDKILELSRK